MHFWSPNLDPDHPMAVSQPERYVLRRLASGRYIAIDPGDQSLVDVEAADAAYGFHTHEAALRAVGELHKLGQGPIDILKVD
jgi:hypothetical protein